MKEISINTKVEIVAMIVLLVSFLTTYLLIPRLISIVRYKKLMDKPDERSSHINKTPTLGGAVFYISLIFGMFTIHFFEFNGASFNLIVGLTILFFIGLKDDLMVLSAQTKLWAQIVAVSFVLIMPDLWISSFSGFLGIGQVPLSLSILMSYFIMIFIINAYNLIDGIDGLAAMLGILIFVIYGLLFYFSGNDFYFLLSILSLGFLLAFLRYNISKSKRIFMGDTGSLIVGFLIAVLTIRFIALPDEMYEVVHIKPVHKFLIALAITFFPIVDVARVILMRLMNKRGAFEPDRCHMHHILIDRGLTHRKASITLTICGGLIFGIVYISNMIMNVWALIGVFIGLYLMTFTVLLLLDYDKRASGYRKRFKALFPRPIQKMEFRVRKKIIFTLKNLFYKDML